MANYIKLLFLENDLVGNEYVEVFAGGASVALSLLFEEYASHVHINDLDRSVYCFWRAVLDQTEDLCRRIAGISVTMDEWARQKAVQHEESPDPFDLAFSTFFLNRTNRSGIIGGGVIGGKAQHGTWKLDARFGRAELVRRIQKIARYRNRITLTQLNAAEYLRSVLPSLPHQTFVYLDPPYYVKGEGLYRNFYEHRDHEEIAQLVREIHHPWLVSYDRAPEILQLYSAYEALFYRLSYSAGDRYRGNEVMFFSPNLTPPEMSSPANIPMRVVDHARLDAWLRE